MYENNLSTNDIKNLEKNLLPYKCPFEYCIKQVRRNPQICNPLQYQNYDALKKNIHNIHLIDE